MVQLIYKATAAVPTLSKGVLFMDLNLIVNLIILIIILEIVKTIKK